MNMKKLFKTNYHVIQIFLSSFAVTVPSPDRTSLIPALICTGLFYIHATRVYADNIYCSQNQLPTHTFDKHTGIF